MNASRFGQGGPNAERRSAADATPERATDAARPGEGVFDQVRSAIGAIRFGEVRVVIQDGVIVQIDRIEKQRLR